MKVRTLYNVFHGVTGHCTCMVGEIFTVKRVIEDPECPDFVEKGIPPMRGRCYEFEGMEGMVHRGELFEVISPINDFKFLKG
jgi:hypothetical protein